MSPEVIAAVIAASVSVLTLIGTLGAQYFGRRATSRDTQQALEAQRGQLDRTLGEQRSRTLNERFATAAEQLGSDKPAVRLAGLYAMAGLVDEWEENRQTCVDVLCAYLRLPYEPDPGQDAPVSKRLAFGAMREVRHTAIRVITAHLKEDAAVSWQALNFDFTGVVFDGGDFADALFSGGMVDFTDAQFSAGEVYFSRACFSGAEVSFSGAEFSGGQVYFPATQFSAGMVYFGSAQFSGSHVYFNMPHFSGGVVSFMEARFSGGEVHFIGARFSGSEVEFGLAQFSGGKVDFQDARFSLGKVDFAAAQFSGSEIDFSRAAFSGSTVDFSRSQFSGSNVDFGNVADWSFPPTFPWSGTPPSGVKLPSGDNQSQA